MSSAAHVRSDEDLALAAQGGDGRAFELLVERFQVRLMSFLCRKLTEHEAEDVLQDAFVQAYVHIKQYDSRWRFSTWIFTIANRMAISRLRQRKNAAELSEHLPANDSPSDRVAHADYRAKLWSIARQVLGEESYTALWLFYVEDQSAQEIAEVLDRSWVSVKTMLHRARRKLEPHLAKLEGFAMTPQPALALVED